MAADIRITYHIRRWRLRRHLGQAALGAQVGLSASTISADEHGDVDIPTSRLCGLAQALRVTLNDLVTWTDAPAPPEDQPKVVRRSTRRGSTVTETELRRGVIPP
jgi:transcriptional regulator with XRE-family HTH domain